MKVFPLLMRFKLTNAVASSTKNPCKKELHKYAIVIFFLTHIWKKIEFTSYLVKILEKEKKKVLMSRWKGRKIKALHDGGTFGIKHSGCFFFLSLSSLRFLSFLLLSSDPIIAYGKCFQNAQIWHIVIEKRGRGAQWCGATTGEMSCGLDAARLGADLSHFNLIFRNHTH